MGTYRDKKERAELYQDAVSTAVNAETLTRGAQALDAGMSAADSALAYVQKQKEIKMQLVVLLRKAQASGLTDADKAEILRLQQALQGCEPAQQRPIARVETQEVPRSYQQMVAEDHQKAKEYGIDLSNPFLASFSGIDKAVVSQELAEEFDLLRLDKFDYAFAAFAGIMGGLIDALCVGTITDNPTESGKLLQATDGAYDKIVMKYAKMQGWEGPRIRKDGTASDPVKSAIGFLERQYPVNYDQAKRSDIKKIVGELSHDELNGLSPSNHHLRGLAHSFSPLGLVTGILDLTQGKTTFFNVDTGTILRYNTGKAQGVDGIFDAVARWFGHCMSDIAGSSGAQGRGAGLPAPFMEIFQQFQFGKVPLSLDQHSGMPVYETIGKATEELYQHGLDLRAFTAMAIPVAITEIMVRLYWFFKQHFYFGKSIRESLPFGKSREMQRMLLIASLSFSSVDVVHGIVKGASESNPVTMLLTFNYVGFVNLGYKLYLNFRLEHAHNRQLREHMQNEVRTRFNMLLET